MSTEPQILPNTQSASIAATSQFNEEAFTPLAKIPLVTRISEAKGRKASSMPTPIHGVDYIVDYYAVLGVERSASQEEITRAHRSQVMGLHGDRLGSAADEIRDIASKKFTLVTKAYDVLRDAVERPAYDQLLKSFPENLISKDGVPIVDLGKRYVSVDNLILGEPPEDSNSRKQIFESQSGFNHAIHTLIEQQFTTTEQPTPALTEAYRFSLRAKLVRDKLLESEAWRDAGVFNREEGSTEFYPEDAIASAKAEIASVKDSMQELATNRLLSVESGAPTLLLPGPNEVLGPCDLASLAVETTARALSTFSNNEERLIAVATERSQTSEKLLEICQWHYLLPRGVEKQDNIPSDSVIVIVQSENSKVVSIRFDSSDEQDQAKLDIIEIHPEDLKNEEKLKEWHDAKVGVILLQHEPELGILMEASWVANIHLKGGKKR